jgi:transporter family-2 protein
LNRSIYYLIAFIVGLVIAANLAMNADVGDKIGNPRAGSAVFWVIGAVVAVIIWLASANRSAIKDIKNVNPLLLLAGALGAALVLVIAILIPKIGAGSTNVLMLTGQVIAGIVIGHMGIWGSAVEPITALKMVGVVIMIGGAYMAVTF